MKLRMLQVFGICGILAIGTLGCNKASKDNSNVIASVGNEKITEKHFNDIVRAYFGDAVKANDFLTNPAERDQRSQLLSNLVNQKALFQFIKLQGLDKDDQVQLQIKSATADAYFQILSERLIPKAEPTDAQLKAFYDDYVNKAKAAKQVVGIPPFDQIKNQLPMIWKHKQVQTARETVLNQINKKYPATLASEYQLNQVQK
jgi:hypothetical protein